MAEFSGFFNSVNGDRKYKAEDFAKYFSTFMSTGVNPALDSLKVYKKNNNTIIVNPGSANINGYLYLNNSELEKAIDITETRIDRVVLQLNIINRTLSINIKKGATNAAPDLQKDNTIFELSLAQIIINNNDFYVKDERDNANICGYMQFLGITDIQEMWDIFNSEWSSNKKIWLDWFNNMQGKSPRGFYIQQDQPSDLKVGDIWIQQLK